MKCEICDTQTATMWVKAPVWLQRALWHPNPEAPIPSCPDCGPQLGYKILAPLGSVSEGS